MLSGQPRRRHALENEPDVRSGKTSLARELPCEGEEALGLRRDGSRVVEKQERARTGESPEIGDRGKLVKKLGGILPEHDVDRLSVGDGALALRPDVVGTNHRPLPAEPGDLSTVEICEPKFLAVRGIRENRDTRTPGARPALGVGSPRLDEGPTEGGARAVVRVGASGLEGGAGPDLALPCRLVAVVLEHREAAGGAFEHVEPTPEQRVGQWPGGEELLRERELRAEFLERRGGPEKIAAQPPQETVEPGRERDERVRLGRAEPERAPGADCALAGSADATPPVIPRRRWWLPVVVVAVSPRRPEVRPIAPALPAAVRIVSDPVARLDSRRRTGRRRGHLSAHGSDAVGRQRRAGEGRCGDRERARPGGPALPPGRGWRKEAVAHAARASKRVTISTATAGRTSSSQAPRSGATPPSVKTQTDRRPARRRCSSGGKPSGPRL